MYAGRDKNQQENGKDGFVRDRRGKILRFYNAGQQKYQHSHKKDSSRTKFFKK